VANFVFGLGSRNAKAGWRVKIGLFRSETSISRLVAGSTTNFSRLEARTGSSPKARTRLGLEKVGLVAPLILQEAQQVLPAR